MQMPRVYKCALIVRSRSIDPRRTISMVQDEKKAQEYFQDMKDYFPFSFLHGWKEQFKIGVDKFIEERLVDARDLMAKACENEGQVEEYRTCLHKIRRLVAGAIQEWELVEQAGIATTCAELDDAIVWNGRGYVILPHSPIIPPFQ